MSNLLNTEFSEIQLVVNSNKTAGEKTYLQILSANKGIAMCPYYYCAKQTTRCLVATYMNANPVIQVVHFLG